MNVSKRYSNIPDTGYVPADEEIDQYLMGNTEIAKRKRIREAMYGDFMEERNRKKEEKAAREKVTAQRAASGERVRGKKQPGRPTSNFARSRNYTSMEPKRKSSKINYDNMAKVIDGGVGTSTDTPMAVPTEASEINNTETAETTETGVVDDDDDDDDDHYYEEPEDDYYDDAEEEYA